MPDTLHFACVVSKKVSPRAVDRNLIKRRCREAARRALKDITLSNTFVFYAARAARGASFADIERDVKSLIGKAAS